MVLADLGRAVALGAAAVAAFVGGLGLPALLVVVFTIGALSVFFDVAYQACLIRLLERERLPRGNSALEASRSAAQVGGPAPGGAMVSLQSVPIAAASSALFFAMSFASIARIRHREVVHPHHGGPRRIGWQVHEGLRFVAGDSALRTVCLASAAFQFFLAAMMTAYLLFLPRQLHLSGTVIGVAFAAAERARSSVPCSPPISRAASATDRCSSRRRRWVTASCCACPRCAATQRRPSAR